MGQEEIKATEYEQILLLGCDVDQVKVAEQRATEEDRYQRSDAIVVLSLDRERRKVRIINLMRDIWIQIPGYGMRKLNEAVLLGGPQTAVQVVNDNFGLCIQKYVQININGLVELVDLFGGVDVELSEDEVEYINEWMLDVRIITERYAEVPAVPAGGLNHLNGMQALAHVRNRSIGYMIERENRVNDVMKSMARKAKNEMSHLECLRYAMAARKYVRTNLKAADIVRLMRYMRHVNPDRIETYHAPEEGSYEIKKDGTWRMEVDFEKAGWLIRDFIQKQGTDRPLIAITFDDGPSEVVTPRILKLLAKHKVPATFSVVGRNVQAHPELIKQMTDQGCEIVNHTWQHENLKDMTEEQIAESVLRTEEAIWKACGEHAVFVRPPYRSSDSRTADVLKTLGKAQLLWNVDPEDWKSKNADTIIRLVLGNVKDQSTVILHDIYPSTYEAAAGFIPELASRGFEFVTVSELLRRKNITVIPGESYCGF